MNKFTRKIMLAIAFLVAGCINIQAQYQLPDPGFEQTWKDVSGKGGIIGTTTIKGQEPVGFHSFITASVGSGFGLAAAVAKQLEPSTTVLRPGTTGRTSAKIWSRSPVGSVIANGNLTTGRIFAGSMEPTEAAGNYNFSDPTASGYNQSFKGRPDAITAWVKFEPKKAVADKGENLARVSAIIHENSRYQDPEAKEYTNIVAKAQLNYAPEVNNGWQQLSIPFVYEKDAIPSYLLLTFTTNKTPGQGSIDDIIYVDDIEFIYNSKLESLKIGGAALDGFDKNKYDYTIYGDGVAPSVDQIEAVSDGKYAAVVKSVNGNVVTIVVKGDDYSANNSSIHTYTVTYKKFESFVESLKVNGAAIDGFSKDKYEYSFTGDAPAVDAFEVGVSYGGTVEKTINQNKITIVVKGSDFGADPANTHTYTITYYNSLLTSVDVNGESVPGFASDKYTYTFSGDVPSLDNITHSRSVSSTIDRKIEGNVVTFTVSGGNIAADPANVHIYTFTYYGSKLSSLKVNGTQVAGFSPVLNEYGVIGAVPSLDAVEAAPVSGATVSKEIKGDAVVVTVKGENFSSDNTNFSTYTITFYAEIPTAKGGYQLVNSGFEGMWNKNQYLNDEGTITFSENTPLLWNSFYTAGGDMADLALKLMANQTGTVERETQDVHGGKYAAKLIGRLNFMGTISNGNLTTGRINMGSYNASDATNYNYSDIANPAYSHLFAGIPDSVSVWIKAAPKKGSDLGSVHMVLHDDRYNFKDPHETTENIAAHGISDAYMEIPASAGWACYKIPFVYNDVNLLKQGSRYLLASFTTNKVAGAGSDGDMMLIDDIQMVYNSKLSSLSIDGENVKGFDKNVYTYNIIGKVSSADAIEAVSDGKGAAVTKSITGEVLTITVSGNDISINPENKHVYTINFIKDLQVEKIAGIYNGSIDIDLSVMGAQPPVMTVPDQIIITKTDPNVIQVSLKNFSFMGMALGDIIIPNVLVSESEDGYSFVNQEEVNLDLLGGAIKAVVNVTGSIKADGQAVANIDVNATGIGAIPVAFKGKSVEEGLRLSALSVSGEPNAFSFDPDIFNYKSLAVTPADVLSYTKADPASKVNVVMDANWLYLYVTNGAKSNCYKLANTDIANPIKAVAVNQAIDGDLTLLNQSEVGGSAVVAGKIIYTKPIVGAAWNVVGMPFVPSVMAITENEKVLAEADWYTYITENGKYKPQSLNEIGNAAIMKLKSYAEATALELTSPAGSSVKGAAFTVVNGYNVCPNNTLTTRKLVDLATADTYYLFDQAAQVFNRVADPATAVIAPSDMFIAFKGSNPVAQIVTPDVYAQGIGSGNSVAALKVYSANGSIYVKGYTGNVEIYLLNGGKIAQKEVSGDVSFKLTPNTYVVRTGTEAAIVIVK